MKTLISKWARPAFFIVLSFIIFGSASAQSKKQLREAKKEAEVKGMVDAQNYIFKAEYVLPMRGGQHYITSEYDLSVAKDTLVSYLPYFGRAYVAPINPDDAGMMFTATKFTYTTVQNKDGWEISISPADTKDVRRLQLSVSKSGYATLHITSVNRDPISYMGYVELKKKKV